MSTSACFDNVFGLSRRDCPCVADRPIEAGISASGLYLDELPGMSLQLASQAQDCGDDSLWVKMDRARSAAFEDLQMELGACLDANTMPARQDGNSQIGDDKNATRTGIKLLRNYHGFTLQTAKVKGGHFKVTAIATAFKGTVPATIAVNVYERTENSDDPLQSYTLNCTSGKVVWNDLPVPLELSMSELGTSNPRYWFVYEPTEGLQAMNTEISCGCGGFKPTWDLRNPQYMSRQQHNGKIWAEWCMAAGTKGDSLADRSEWTVENPSMGIMLRVQFACDIVSSFCADVPNYAFDPIQKVIAHAGRFRAGAILLQDILTSTKINRYTMTAGDQLEKLRDQYDKEFRDRVLEYLCPTLSENGNINRFGDCRRCLDRQGLRRGLLKA
jgi:hypothetical protein